MDNNVQIVETMVIEWIDYNIVGEEVSAWPSTAILPQKRALSGGDIPAVNTSEDLSKISNIDIKRERRRAFSG